MEARIAAGPGSGKPSGGRPQPGDTHYANCQSQHLFEALSIYQQSHELV